MRYVVVEPRKAEETIKRLRAGGAMRKGEKVVREAGRVLIPLSDQPPLGSLKGLETTEKESPSTRHRPSNYRDLIMLPEGVKARLPRAFDVVGDIAVVKLDESLEQHAGDIARALTEWNPAIKRVALDSGVEGELRVRGLRSIIGQDLRTEHHENGLRLKVDLGSAYYSPRLSGERARIAALARPGERVLDMFAGVGPFAVLVAKRQPAAEVVAVDANPAACALLRENATMNRASVDVREGRIEVLSSGLGKFDRIIMNLPRGAESYFPIALDLLRGGDPSTITRLHFYAVGREGKDSPDGHTRGPGEMLEKTHKMRSIGAELGWSVDFEITRMKTFSTRVWIWRLDARASPLPKKRLDL